MAESLTPNGYEYGILPDSQTPFWRGDEMPLLGQLKDVDVKGAADHYVLMYDILSQTWKAKKMIDDFQVSEGMTYSSKKIEELIASIPGGGGGEPGTNNYEDLTNKPSIAGVTLSGNKTLHQLGIQGELQPVGYVHIANGEIYVEIPIDDTATDSEHIWSAQKVISMLATKASISTFQNYYTKNEVDNLIAQAGGGTLHDLKQKLCGITKNFEVDQTRYGIKFTAEDTGKLLWMDAYGAFNIELDVDGTRYFLYNRVGDVHYPSVFPVPTTSIYEQLPKTVFLIPLRKQGSTEVILAEGFYNYKVTMRSGEYYIAVTGVTISSVYSMYDITSVEFHSGWTEYGPSYNWQMYSHDGGGSGSNVVVNQILSSGVQIAQIVVDGVPTSIYAPQGGGSVSAGGLRVYGPYNVKFGSNYAQPARGQDARRLHDEYCIGNINMSIFDVDSKIGYDANLEFVSREGDSNTFTRYAVGATNRGYRMWAKIAVNYNSALSEPFDYTMSVYFECDEDVTSSISTDSFKINSSSQVNIKEVPDTTPIKMIDGNDQDTSITPSFPTIATAAMVAGTINVTTDGGATLTGDFVGMYDPTFSNNSLQFTGEISGVLPGPDSYIGQTYGKIGRNGSIDLHMTFFDEGGDHLPDFEIAEITIPVLRVVEVPQNPGNTFLTSGQVSVTGTSPEIDTSRDYLVSCTFGTLKASGVFNHNTTGALLNRNVVTLNVSYATSLSQASNAVYTIVIPLVGDGTIKTFDTTATVIKLGMVNEVPNIPVSDIRIKEIADFSSDISSLTAVNSLQTSELGSLATVNSLQTSEINSLSISASEMRSEIDYIMSELANN